MQRENKRRERGAGTERFLGSLEVVKRTKEGGLARSGKGPKIKRELGPHFVHEKIIGDSRELLLFYYLTITNFFLQCMGGGATFVSSYNVGR